MLVSVIVPAYNRAHLLGKTIESILNQTYKSIEIIIVDDGSTDNTEEVVKGYAIKSTLPIKYIKKNNGGCASARNQGIEFAKGEYIAFLDSDDQYTPNAIEASLTCLLNSNADFVYSPSIEVFNDLEFLSLPAASEHPELFAKEHFLTTLARSCSVLYKREIFDKVRLDETLRYNEDSDFLQRVALNFKAAYSPVPTGKVFHHGGNKSGNRVGIYKALLKSSEVILNEFPSFKKELGNLANGRLTEIKINLIESLILVKNFKEARKIAIGIKSCLPFKMRISLFLRSPFPMKKITLRINLKSHILGILKSLKIVRM